MIFGGSGGEWRGGGRGWRGVNFGCDHFAPQASLIFGDLGVEGSGRELEGGELAGVEGSWMGVNF